ncbi:MAG: TolC family protein [Bacteroidales bacterium]|nr:TolC family protein [Bacteroidales bacterium]
MLRTLGKLGALGLTISHFVTSPLAFAAEPGGAEPAPPSANATPERVYTLSELVAIGLNSNPRLAQARLAIDNARGRALQAGLYPNPTIDILGDELGDQTGRGGIWTTPKVSQEIVTARKLRLNRAAVNQEANQAVLGLQFQRYQLLAEIREAYFSVVTIESRIEILRRIVSIMDESVEQTENLLKARQVARLDLVQLEVQAEQFRAELEATEQELPAAFRRLAAIVGVANLPKGIVAGDLLGELPPYELDRIQAYVLGIHPNIAAARAGVERAQILLRRAEVEPIPNLTLSSGYTRQNQNKSSDGLIGLSFTLPVWNRNQGNIQAAQAELGSAIQQVTRVENSLTDQVATAYRNFTAARRRADRYRTAILPRAEETNQLSLKAYQGGQFEYLRVLEAQRSLAQSKLEYIRVLSEAWLAASAISGLTLEDNWPPRMQPQGPPASEPLDSPQQIPPPAPRAKPRIQEMNAETGIRPLVAQLLRHR